MITINKQIEKYITDHSTPEDELLAELYRQTHLRTVHPQMVSGHHQGKLLEMISRMISPEYILEIGTFTGYSAICLARGLQQEGRLITIEKEDEHNTLALKYFQLAGLEDKITLMTGDAKEIIPGLDKSFDLVFIDAEKDEYVDYYDLTFEKVRPGGFILADNVLWGGKILDKPVSNDHFTKGILAFNDKVKKDNSVENIILPIRDGVSIIRKKKI